MLIQGPMDSVSVLRTDTASPGGVGLARRQPSQGASRLLSCHPSSDTASWSSSLAVDVWAGDSFASLTSPVVRWYFTLRATRRVDPVGDPTPAVDDPGRSTVAESVGS